MTSLVCSRIKKISSNNFYTSLNGSIGIVRKEIRMARRNGEEQTLYRLAKQAYYDWMNNPQSEFARYKSNEAWARYRSFCFVNRITPKDI